ncbi:unnamed protein product [Nippostrongylus brasiliensis]|uniref:Neuropeptide n=1 Tax=Nippostrongylus brasiliensis TaxID=27835 RepID=A0A0N4YSD5_NIPBR|nr:unnamed protein product [Nippostrongylus brasiliensis]
MDLRGVLVLLLCTLMAVVRGQDDADGTMYTGGRLLPSSYGLGWRGFVMPVYGGEKRSMTEKMKSLKGRYNGQIRDILFGK